MEQETEPETVYFVETPYAANEEEIATSYIAMEESKNVDNEEEMEITYEDHDIESADKSEFACEDKEITPAKIITVVLAEENEVAVTEPESPVDRLACRICGKKFSKMSNKLRHLRKLHNIRTTYDTNIKCIECNLHFNQVSRLRKHLTEEHKLVMTEQNLYFPNMEAFKKWKCEIERKSVCSYTRRYGAWKGQQGPRYFYACHRSGKYAPKNRGPRQRMIKAQGSCKMGIMCTSAMSVHVNRTNVFVIYCAHHYGHGKETTLIQLSTEEQNAIAESVDKGIPYEKLLDEIRDGQSSKDHFQLHLLKKRDYKSINNCYSFEDFNTLMTDAESVDHWINLCSQMENSPILYYKKEECFTDKGNQEEFVLIIMTEFQKHILLTSDKNVLCVDSLYRKKGGRFYLTVLFIMDENDLAFPVAFCISNKVEKNVISLFFQSIYESTGPLECNFFMSDSEPFYNESWKEIMNDNSRWLWSLWYVDYKFQIQLRSVLRGKVSKRADAYKTMRMLIECQNQTVFHCMLDNFIESLKDDPDSKDLGDIVKNHYAPNAEIWAYCYRKEIDLGTNIHLEIMHQTFRYCCREGRKKRLDKFIFVIMKLVRDKMLDRLTSMMNEDRMELVLETINSYHNLGLEIPPEHITALSEKVWLIHSENDEENYYVMLENAQCPDLCNLKCSECDICVHMYVCSCIHNLINANVCQHIHAVVWHLLTPHFSPPPSPVPLLDTDQSAKPGVSTDFLDKLLKRTHEVYKQIQGNKCNLNRIAVNALMKHMNECMDICSGKVVEEKNPLSPPPVNVVEEKKEPPPLPVTNPGTIYLINSAHMKIDNNQPVVFSNPMTSVDSNSIPQGKGNYVLVVPSTAPNIKPL